ncbi:hypothetical protein [Aquimarina brevivitae]|uniref:Uncharacterized protein n=1 Tax=Aquimarina brevivitae TaxID=323412 RepID=A0A4Q7PI48_9FLAO|nr:hypothetical protein [Aquimarina brevivitae]RZS99887.1 hypothetical protein EV197_1118 [Aquimarina brevivitae]
MKQISKILFFLLLFLYSSCNNNVNNSIGPLVVSQLIDLGKLNTFYKNSFDYTSRGHNPHKKMTYTFSVDFQRSYIIKSDRNVQLILKDNQPNRLASRANFIPSKPVNSEIYDGAQLTSEVMTLEIINKDSTNLTGRPSFSIKAVSDNVLDLATPSPTLDESIIFSNKDYEPDNRLGISFDIISTTYFNISANGHVSIGLHN